MARRKKQKFGLLEATVCALGVSPIPVVGEVCATKFIYDIIREAPEPLGSKSMARNIVFAGAVAGLMRLSMYSTFYKDVYNYLKG